MLDAHPELAIPPETHFVPDLIERERECSAPTSSVDAIVAAAHLGRLRARPDGARARRAAGSENAAGVLRAFYGLYAERQGKPRWGDKTPGYVRRMRLDRRRPCPRRGSST